jgi:epoxide hydrolase
MSTQTIETFRIDVPQADVDDLKQRLTRTRWADELPPSELENLPTSGAVQPGYQLGVPLSYVKPLVERWRDSYDWRAWEAKLNQQPQFVTTIDDQDIHFFHVRSEREDAIPLLLLHGWPNTSFEYFGLIDTLTNPAADGADAADAFHVIIPTQPGFGFSGPTTTTGWNAGRVAKAYAELMRRLGYDRYGVHGNDAGAIVSPVLVDIDRDHAVAAHVNQIFSFPRGDAGEFDGLTPDDMQYLQFLQSFVDFAIHDYSQMRQPQTLAHALSDSPAGQLAWNGQLLGHVMSDDELLTAVSIYWFTNTSGSSARFYAENRGYADGKTSDVPIGLASFGGDFRPIRKFAERDFTNIISWSEFDRGGHWAAHDAPDLLVGDIRQFFRRFR